jgi:hypothetical protein
MEIMYWQLVHQYCIIEINNFSTSVASVNEWITNRTFRQYNNTYPIQCTRAMLPSMYTFLLLISSTNIPIHLASSFFQYRCQVPLFQYICHIRFLLQMSGTTFPVHLSQTIFITDVRNKFLFQYFCQVHHCSAASVTKTPVPFVKNIFPVQFSSNISSVHLSNICLFIALAKYIF